LNVEVSHMKTPRMVLFDYGQTLIAEQKFDGGKGTEAVLRYATRNKHHLQNRLKNDWKGLTLPGGYIEKNESIIDAVIREMKEETGLDIQNPRLCGIKQFPIENMLDCIRLNSMCQI
jgi:ADP-ribose pyrophosphatase YjhB (NUDIX family)